MHQEYNAFKEYLDTNELDMDHGELGFQRQLRGIVCKYVDWRTIKPEQIGANRGCGRSLSAHYQALQVSAKRARAKAKAQAKVKAKGRPGGKAKAKAKAKANAAS